MKKINIVGTGRNSTRLWETYLIYLEKWSVRMYQLIHLPPVGFLFLIREAAGFYIDEHEAQVSAYLKATMIEGFAILFSFSRCKSVLLAWTRKLVVILLCSFTLWVMSGKLMKTASSDTYRVQALRQTLEALKSKLFQKEQLRQAFLKRNLLTTARRYERGIDQIRVKRDRVQKFRRRYSGSL